MARENLHYSIHYFKRLPSELGHLPYREWLMAAALLREENERERKDLEVAQWKAKRQRRK